jgi:hypothetical protein
MIIKSTYTGALGVPCKDSTQVVDLSPGYNYIANDVWAKARPNAIRIIEAGSIVEEFVKADVKDISEKIPKELQLDVDKEPTKKMIPAELSDIDRKQNKVFNVVKETYHIPTLTYFNDTELRQDVRLELMKQLDGIEKGTIKG